MVEKIAVWPDGFWCWPGEVNAMLNWRTDDFEIIEVEFDDEDEPILPKRFAEYIP